MFIAGLCVLFSGLPADALLTSTEALAGMKDAVIVDTREAALFAEGHIPGAVNVPAAELSKTRNGVRGMLKPTRDLAQLLAQAGVDPTQHVVVYSGMADPSDVKNATRVFWALEYLSYEKVSVLDGGFAKWKKEGRPVETGGAKGGKPLATEWYLKVRPELLTTREELAGHMREHDGVTLDMRSPEEYAGLEKKEFVERPGHIPGAHNLPAGDVLEGEDHTFKTGAALKEMLEGEAVDGDRAAVTYCNTGRDATVGYFALRLYGHENASVYDGSMAEWGRRPGLQPAP